MPEIAFSGVFMRLGILLGAILCGRVAAAAYDGSWHRQDDWGGEYPSGFSVLENVTISIRQSPAPDAPTSLPCLLRKGSTYHPWNTKRVREDALKFVTFNRIGTYEANEDFTSEAYLGDEPVKVHFSKGDRWRDLYYVGEGQILFQFGNVEYRGGQDLFEHSRQIDPADGRDEWLGLRCANGVSGWILMKDIEGMSEFGGPNVIAYGTAVDGAAAAVKRTYWDHNGSVVYLEAEGSRRRFRYQSPRSGMLDAGASPDDVVFEGTVRGNEYIGVAFLYHRGCEPAPYRVRGPILNDSRRVVLTGKAPRLNKNCQRVGVVNDRLVFDLQSWQ